MLTISRSIRGGVRSGEVMQYTWIIGGAWLSSYAALSALGNIDLNSSTFWGSVGAAIVGGIMAWLGASKGNRKTAEKANETAERTDAQDQHISFLFDEIKKSNAKRDHLQHQLDENLIALEAAQKASTAAKAESMSLKIQVEKSNKRVEELEKRLGMADHGPHGSGI